MTAPAPTVGYICVSQWPDCCENIHLSPWAAAVCRFSDADHPERNVRAVWAVSKGARPSYRRLSDDEASAVARASASMREPDAAPARAFPAVLLGIVLLGLGQGCTVPEGGQVDCLAAADIEVPVADTEEQRAAWSAAFGRCRAGALVCGGGR